MAYFPSFSVLRLFFSTSICKCIKVLFDHSVPSFIFKITFPAPKLFPRKFFVLKFFYKNVYIALSFFETNLS